jgi:hypothetical protein
MRISCSVHVSGVAGPTSDTLQHIAFECHDDSMLDVIYRVHAYARPVRPDLESDGLRLIVCRAMPMTYGCTELREIEVLGLSGERTLVSARCEERCAKTYWQRVITLRIPVSSTGKVERRVAAADATPLKILRCVLDALGVGACAGVTLGLRLQYTPASAATPKSAKHGSRG